MKKQSFQRILSFFLMLCLVICMLPTALAAESETPTNGEEVVGSPSPYYVANEDELRYAGRQRDGSSVLLAAGTGR